MTRFTFFEFWLCFLQSANKYKTNYGSYAFYLGRLRFAEQSVIFWVLIVIGW